MKNRPPRKRALKNVEEDTYATDKPPVVTIVHSKSKYTSFSVEKNLSKDLISRKIDEFVDKEAILIYRRIFHLFKYY